jgi:hypothetical protein
MFHEFCVIKWLYTTNETTVHFKLMFTTIYFGSQTTSRASKSSLFHPVFFFFLFVRWDFGYCGHYWPIVPAPDDRWWWLWRNWWNEDWPGKQKYSEKTCPSVILSTTNPTWLDPVLNPGRCGGKPATNRLSYGAAFHSVLLWLRIRKAFILFLLNCYSFFVYLNIARVLLWCIYFTLLFSCYFMWLKFGLWLWGRLRTKFWINNNNNNNNNNTSWSIDSIFVWIVVITQIINVCKLIYYLRPCIREMYICCPWFFLY